MAYCGPKNILSWSKYLFCQIALYEDGSCYESVITRLPGNPGLPAARRPPWIANFTATTLHFRSVSYWLYIDDNYLVHCDQLLLLALFLVILLSYFLKSTLYHEL